MVSKLLKGATLGAALTLAAYGTASASNIPFTWNPAGSSPAIGGAGTEFTGDNVIVSDFSAVKLTPGGVNFDNFTETGFLPVTQIQLGGLGIVTPGLNVPAGYGLVFSYTATGTQQAPGGNPIPPVGTTYTGTINTLSFTLIGYKIGALQTQAKYTANLNGTVTSTLGGYTQVDLATGVISGPGSVTLTGTTHGLQPGAGALTTFAYEPGQAGFFVAPASDLGIFLESSFTNTPGVAKAAACGTILNPAECVAINGGGGNANLVPEPGTLALFGAGLIGLALMLGVRRRQA